MKEVTPTFQEEVKKAQLPKGAKELTIDEMRAIKAFDTDFRKKHPLASHRQIKRAISKKFNVGYLPKK